MASHIFGPVNSRRFGISLGVDLSPSCKQCNFDCLYCEVGAAKTMQTQQEIANPQDILTELEGALYRHGKIDFITLTANGEPTLYPHLATLIDSINRIKKDRKLLILTNGATLHKKEVREALYRCDSVKVSLDCASRECFRKLDRADASFLFEEVIAGIRTFARERSNELIIEVMVVARINDSDAQMQQVAELAKELLPGRVDIGSVDRPPAFDVSALSQERLLQIAEFFRPLPVFVPLKKRERSYQGSYDSAGIKALLQRRPLSVIEINSLFDAASRELIEKMLQAGELREKSIGGAKFFLNIEKSLDK